MNGVEAAASLFGPEEPASDPFATLGEPQTSHEDLFPITGVPYSSHPSATAQLSNPINTESTATLPSHEYTQQELQPQNSSYTAGDYALDLGAESTSQHGWYSESAYDIPEPSLNEQVSQHFDAAFSTQEPCAPPSNFANVTTSSQPTYYTSTQPGQGYSPPATSSNSYSYSLPASQLSGPQYTPSYPASSQTAYIQQNSDFKPPVPISVPPPAPAPVDATNRPKLFNAYDPPFPTTTKSRRNVAPRMGSSQIHSGYNAYQSPSPPVTLQGPFGASTALPTLPPRTAEQIGIQPHSEWSYSNHNTSTNPNPPSDGPAADPELVETFAGNVNPYDRSVGVHAVAAPSDQVEPRVPDYTLPQVPTTSQAHDLYHLAPSASPTKIRSRVSSPVIRPPLSTSFRGSSPRNPLSPPSPLARQPLTYGRSTPHNETKVPTVGANHSLAPGEIFSGQNGGQTTTSDEVQPYNTDFTNGSWDQQSSSNDIYSADESNGYLPASVNGRPSDPYTPESYVNGSQGERTSSPTSIRSWTGNSYYPPTNQHSPPRADVPRHRSMSNGPMLLPASTDAKDPYAPSQQSRHQKSETDYGTYGYLHGRAPSLPSLDQTLVQEVSMKPFQTPYAPSPSLLGANDPLGRTAARIPVFSFGFGGKFVTCFHGTATLNTGFDVALSSRNSTGVYIRVLKQLIPESALTTSAVAFPGPLFSDPGSLTSLVRTGPSSQTKTKKAQVVKYLCERMDELSLGLRYHNPDSIEKRRAEGKVVLIKLMKVMVEHDGRLTGTPQLDQAVRMALLPHLKGSTDPSGALTTTFSTSSDPQSSVADPPSIPYPVLNGVPTSQEDPVSVITLKPSSLDKIQGFLLCGERREAYQYALDEKLWAHAMVIASSIDKDAWKEVVNDFLKNELRPKDLASGIDKSTNGRECLRVAYSLFSGQGAAAVQELMPQTVLSRTSRSQPTLPSQITPRTPSFVVPAAPTHIPVESISRWAEAVAMMLSSPLSQETSAALTSLGDQLVANQLFEAAHACYLLAPQTSPIGGLGNSSTRIVLVGSQSPQTLPNFSKDPDPLIFSEIVEFALSLAAIPRGQDSYQGIPHLQPYRFIRAMALAEIGDIQLASRYCEAITAAVGRSPSYFTPALLDHLKGLSDRITGIAHVDKSGSWMGAKLSKPSLDTIGGWLEGRFTKLVTGDTDTPTPGDDDGKAEDRSFAGPFSHYSTISSTTPSARSSPQPSLANGVPPARSGSALAYPNYPPIDRASSAMDYVKPRTSPTPRVYSANPAAATFSYSTSSSQNFSSPGISNGYNTSEDMNTARPAENGNETIRQEVNWWDSDGNSPTKTPTASTFLRVDSNALPSASGFISLMDNESYSPSSPVKVAPEATLELDDEDLGFGNTRRDKSKESKDEQEGDNRATASQAPEPTKSEPTGSNPATNGSWISRWWKRSDSAMPGPVKASLGEESTFYYDKDLKRWVNKTAGSSETSKPAALPPPPSRAHTASPGMLGARPPGTSSDARPPPSRPASAIDLSTSPPSKTVTRVRSNLAPLPETAPSTPTGSRATSQGPPPGRPKSQASKRNIRSRYVDVFQQETGA